MTVPARVFVTPRAKEQIRTINTWWCRGRPASPEMFLRELARCFEILKAFPNIGRRCVGQEMEGARRLLLLRTGHHVYYRCRDRQHIDIVAVWHTARGRPPDGSV